MGKYLLAEFRRLNNSRLSDVLDSVRVLLVYGRLEDLGIKIPHNEIKLTRFRLLLRSGLVHDPIAVYRVYPWRLVLVDEPPRIFGSPFLPVHFAQRHRLEEHARPYDERVAAGPVRFLVEKVEGAEQDPVVTGTLEERGRR